MRRLIETNATGAKSRMESVRNDVRSGASRSDLGFRSPFRDAAIGSGLIRLNRYFEYRLRQHITTERRRTARPISVTRRR